MSRSISWRHFFRICTSAESASLVCFRRAWRFVSWISTTTLVTSLATVEIASLRSSVRLSSLYKGKKMSRKSTAMFGLLSLSRFVAGRIHVFPSLTWHYSLQIFVDSQISLVACFARFCICLGACFPALFICRRSHDSVKFMWHLFHSHHCRTTRSLCNPSKYRRGNEQHW